MDDGEFGIGFGSVMAIIGVAFLLLVLPLFMGSVAAPSFTMLLLIPVVLIIVFLLLQYNTSD
ncbi:uncharacterized protein LOC110687553 [Chenopodium quinoa]|uniref:uncharacterized protein LOC110687553 n=1 Tax=Chenopodium quinoa TaxID=63459 RepID=UPI000B794912|nr:uncharacterized protein LOC110687553 [Chenopodium quinoa]